MEMTLYRDNTDKIVAGVASGLARYLDLDVWIVRIAFVILMFANSVGLWLYLLLWMFIPPDPESEGAGLEHEIESGAETLGQRAEAAGKEFERLVKDPEASRRGGILIGGALVVWGLIALAGEILAVLDIAWPPWLDFDTLWPLLLIAGGIALIVRRRR